ncbi:hypothetical protein [Sphingomonas koreensis]
MLTAALVLSATPAACSNSSSFQVPTSLQLVARADTTVLARGDPDSRAIAAEMKWHLGTDLKPNRSKLIFD